MYGCYRFVLAHMVLLSHFWISLTLWAGPYAVFSFFLLSGFLMAQVLQTTYPAGLSGTARFWSNRALRIYPPYWAAFALAVVAIAVVPEVASHLNPRIQWPSDPGSWLRNLVLFGLNRDVVRVVPPAWSLDLELCWYLLMPLGLARNDRLRGLWLVVALGWTVHAVATGTSFQDRYSSLEAAALPFALGATVYRFRGALQKRLPWRRHLPIAAGLYVVNATVPGFVDRTAFGACFYVSLLLTAYGVVCLSQLRAGELRPGIAALDRLLGDLSYPVFLCHFSLGSWVIWAGLADDKGPALLMWGILIANAGALLIHFGVERPLVRVRDRIRGRAVGTSATARPAA